jgi:hypothetical protein
MLDSLFVTPAITAIEEALTSARVDGALAVVGNARLASALAKRPARGDAGPARVVPVGLSARAAKKTPGALADLSSITAGELGAVIGVDATDESLRDWTRVVRDGGAIVLVDRGHAPEASRRALCAGLTEIEQRRVGRLVITSGLVTHL